MSADDLAQGMTRDTVPLMLGHPDPTTLLTSEIQQAVHRTMSQAQSYRALQYGPEQGASALIQFLVDRLNREEGLSITPENIMIVAGSTHAVDMIARLYAKPGGVVIVEAPSYADAIHIFRDHHVELHPIPMDDKGMIVTELENLLDSLNTDGRTASLLYSIPSFHNPTGITLIEDRRREIVRLARQHGFVLVEDDVYRDLSFEGMPPPRMIALADADDALSIGSFSKTLAPGLRLGWLVGSPEAIQRFVNCGTTQMGGGANPFAASIVSEYCAGGSWEAHIEHLRETYRKRRDVALAALSRCMPAEVTWTHPAGGFFIWLRLPGGLSATEVKRAAREQGVLVASGTGFFVNPPDGEHHIRIAFSYAPLDEIDRGIQLLAQTIESLKSPVVR